MLLVEYFKYLTVRRWKHYILEARELQGFNFKPYSFTSVSLQQFHFRKQTAHHIKPAIACTLPSQKSGSMLHVLPESLTFVLDHLKLGCSAT